MKDIEKIKWIRDQIGGCSIIDAKNAYYFCDKDMLLAYAYLKELWLGLGHNPPWTNEQIREHARKKLND